MVLLFKHLLGRSPRVAMFGDLGNVNAQALPRLQEETQSDLYDMIIHNGDFAYDMETVTTMKIENNLNNLNFKT